MVLSWPLRIATLSKGGRFDLTAFMAGQTDGFWYDLTKTDRLFQEDIGPTPADDPTEVIGLALSSRLWSGKTFADYVASQPNLAPAFVSGGAGWTVTGSDATHIATFGAGSLRYQSDTTSPVLAVKVALALTVGRCFEVISPCTSRTGGSVKSDSFGVAVGLASAVGTRKFYGKATSTTFEITRNSAGVDLTLGDLTIKEVSRYPATQTTSTFKPTVQAEGGKGDGLDDRLTTGYAAGSGDNFLVCPKTTVPATLSATQVQAGAMDASSNGWYMGVTASGALRGKVGATTLDTTGLDFRAAVHDLAMWTEGTTLYLWADGAIVASGPWTGAIPATTWNLWALNNNGAASNYSASANKAFLAGRQALTSSRARQICAAY